MLRVHAPAKINLCLAVDRPEPDGPRKGWHRICSWMCCVGLRDTVELQPAPGPDSTWQVVWEAGPQPEYAVGWPLDKDLGVRAHLALEAHVGRRLPVAGRIVKAIPAGAGLGGGSSDAAAVLLGLNHLFELGLIESELRAVGITLGSDIAFFIDEQRTGDLKDGELTRPPRPALVRGFGDEIERLSRKSVGGWRALLSIPWIPCPTPDVYRAFDQMLTADHRFRDADCERLARTTPIDAAALFNDLARPAERVAREVGIDIAALASALRRPAHVSGSGSTVFTLIRSDEDGDDLAERACTALDERGSDTLRLVLCGLI